MPQLGLTTDILNTCTMYRHTWRMHNNSERQISPYALHSPQIKTSIATLQREQYTEFSTADNKPCITPPPHPPEEQEKRKTAKASLVASPIFHPNLILSLERELKKSKKQKKSPKISNSRVKLNVLMLHRALSVQTGHLQNVNIEAKSTNPRQCKPYQSKRRRREEEEG